MKSNEKILITGGTGFLGRYVVQSLASSGFVPTILTRNLQTEVFGKYRRQINLVESDLFDSNSVYKLLREIQPDMIIHLAGYTFRKDEPFDILENFNHKATVELLDQADSLKIKKFILTGTADEYGFQNAPQSEKMSAMPISDYAISKNKAVEHALNLHEHSNFPIIVARPFTIYGIGQPPKMFVSQAVDCAVRGLPFEMSKGEQKRDLLFVTDFVNAIIKLLTTDEIEGEIFNVGSGQSIALRELAEKIWEIAGADEKLLKVGARQTNASELHDTQADIRKIKMTLDWQPEVSLAEGLKLIIDKAKANLK